DINNLYTRDKIAGSKKEAIKIAINAGIDMSMVPYSSDVPDGHVLLRTYGIPHTKALCVK
ncbi:hypothetical protein PZH42_29265, partial [Bacteroides cellulosilyticus]